MGDGEGNVGRDLVGVLGKEKGKWEILGEKEMGRGDGETVGW
jgi:hypothetical protein